MTNAAAPMRAYRTLFSGALVAIALMGDSYLYAVLPVSYEEVGISLVAVGWLLSANRYIRLLTNPLAGVVGSYIGWGRTFSGAMWLSALLTAGYALLKGVWALLPLRVLWGLSWSFLRLGGMAAVLADRPVGHRGRLMGLFTGIFRLGSLVGVVAGGFLTDRLGFSPTLFIFALIMLIGAVVSSLPPALDGRWGAPSRSDAPSVAAETRHRRWLPGNSAEWAVSLSACTLHLVVSGLLTGTLGILVKERLGSQISIGNQILGAATLTGLLLGSRFLIDLIAGPLLGHWADRRGRGRVLNMATVGLALALQGLGWTHSPGWVTLATACCFVAGAGASTVLDAWAGDLSGDDPARFLSVYSTWLDFGAATGPLLGVYLVAHGGIRLAYFVGVVLLLLTWMVCHRLIRSWENDFTMQQAG